MGFAFLVKISPDPFFRVDWQVWWARDKFASQVPINQLVGMQQLHGDSGLIG